jgi:predicted enzyme related to lactoylglutathione lyase
MPHNPVRWFEIYVQDMQRAKAFYQSVLKTELQKLADSDLEMWAFPMLPDKPGTSGSLVKIKGFPSGGNSTLVYFACEDCAVEAARVVPAGGRIQRDKMSIGEYGFVALAIDTEGNMFGLHSMQ